MGLPAGNSDWICGVLIGSCRLSLTPRVNPPPEGAGGGIREGKLVRVRREVHRAWKYAPHLVVQREAPPMNRSVHQTLNRAQESSCGHCAFFMWTVATSILRVGDELRTNEFRDAMIVRESRESFFRGITFKFRESRRESLNLVAHAIGSTPPLDRGVDEEREPRAELGLAPTEREGIYGAYKLVKPLIWRSLMQRPP